MWERWAEQVREELEMPYDSRESDWNGSQLANVEEVEVTNETKPISDAVAA